MKIDTPQPANDAELLLGLYSAISEPEQYWAALDLIQEFGSEHLGQMTETRVQQHAERLQKLIENLLENAPENDELRKHLTIRFNSAGKILDVGKDAASLLGNTDCSEIWNLPFFGNDTERLKQFLRSESSTPLNIVLPAIGDRVSNVVRVTSDEPIGSFALRFVKLSLAPGAATVFKESFDVSEAQFRVLELLISGNSAESVATKLNRSIETVRSHIKALSQKLVVRSQAELVSRSLSIPVGSTAKPGLKEERDIVLSGGIDGGRVQYFLNGSPSGRTVLYFQQAIDGPNVTGGLQCELSKAGLNLVSIARPGAGQSERNKDAYPNYLQASADAHKRVLDSLGLETNLLLAVGTGLPHALAYARSFAPNATILAINPFPPFVSTAACGGLPGRWRGFATLVYRAPFLLQTTILLAYRLFSLDPRKQAEKVMRDEIPDGVSTQVQDDIIATLEKNLTLNAINRAKHFMEEAEVMRRDWCQDALAECPDVKINLVQGTGKFSIADDLFQKLANDLPNTTAQKLSEPLDPIHLLGTSWVSSELLAMTDKANFKP